MRRTNQVVLAFFGLVLGWVAFMSTSYGAEAPAPEVVADDAAAKDAKPPAGKLGTERELVFKDSPRTRAGYDPSHYEAEFELVFRYPDYSDVDAPIETTSTSRVRDLPPKLGAIVNQTNPRDVNPYAKPRPGKVEYWLRTLAGRINEKLRPPKGLVDSLCATSSFGAGSASTHTERVLVLKVKVRDDEKDALEKKIRALTLLVDEGLSPQYHEDNIASVKLLEQYLGELKNSAAEKEERHAEMKQELGTLDSVKDLSQDALSTLIAHKHMLTVKRAGARARIDAGKKLLATGHSEQIMTTRFNAEIELAGIEAEEKKVDEIIATRMKRTELEAEIKRNWDRLGRTKSETSRAVAEDWAYPEMSEILVTVTPGKIEPNRSTEQSGGKPWWL